MGRAIAFAALLLVACLYALHRGGAPERSAAAVYLMALAASDTAAFLNRAIYSSFDPLFFAIDMVTAAALLGLALYSNRYWTLWAASLQIVTVGGHFSKLAIPEILAPAYAITVIIWSYATIPLLVVATRRHRERIRRFGKDADWS